MVEVDCEGVDGGRSEVGVVPGVGGGRKEGRVACDEGVHVERWNLHVGEIYLYVIRKGQGEGRRRRRMLWVSGGVVGWEVGRTETKVGEGSPRTYIA